MSKINAMLDYQKNDIELRKILKVINDSEDSKRQERAKEAFDIAKKTVNESEDTAKTINSFFDKSVNFGKEVQPQIEALASQLEKATDQKTADEIIQKLLAIRAKIVDVDKKAGKDKIAGESCLAGYAEAQSRGMRAREVHADAKAKVDAKKKENSVQIDVLTNQITKLEKQVDKVFLDRYKILASDKKFPPLVPISEKSCGGCGMQMSISCIATVEKEEYGKCDNCQRMVYKR